MKYSTLLILGLILTVALMSEAKSKSKKQKNKQNGILPMAEPCKPSKCKLPDCRCSDAALPTSKFQGKENQIPQV